MPFEIPNTTNIEPGTYKGQLMRVDSEQGQFGPMRKWFWLVDVNGKGEELSVITSVAEKPGVSRSLVEVAGSAGCLKVSRL